MILRPVFEKLGASAFDMRFNFFGGRNVDFITRCRQNEMNFHWAAEMVIVETVPDTTGTRRTWIALRGLSIGAIDSHLRGKMAQMPRLGGKLAAKVLVLLPLLSLRAVQLFRTEQRTLAAVASMIVTDSGLLAAIGIKFQLSKTSKITP
jgi:hypothetical protein